MLKLTGEHIAKLNDTDLRELVFELCKAELKKHGLPVSAVTAGGNQTASDGGVDVRVNLSISSTPVKPNFVPRPQTIFQVKCEDMPPAKIRGEMELNGKLRPSIKEVLDTSGAYILVSSQGTVADSRLKERIAAMREVIALEPNAANIHLDFYDRKRLATWVEEYAGVALWVRHRIGEPLSGWQGYGNWTGDKTNVPYQKDNFGRITSKSTGSSEPMPVENGIHVIREQLAKTGTSIRLIGLSGTGKTRFVQALFEEGIGQSPLDTAIVAYTDQGLNPQPSAREMLQQLGMKQQRAIVVVDNCNPATHQELTKTVTHYSNSLSLITVEYDVTDDEPEETHVFELSGSSPDVLDAVIAQREPHISPNDRRTIVEFSGGNARIALALAATVENGKTLGVLKNNELFNRLFLQNQTPDKNLLRAAEVCSLVYSFDGEVSDATDAELSILSNLARLDSDELFEHIAELKRRKLVQTRSKWRAVLPHALANRLAKQALEKIPKNKIVSAFQQHKRLLKSFSRRLGYLHDSLEARAIATDWMNSEEWLKNPLRLNQLGVDLFRNLAPIVQEQALKNIEIAVQNHQGDELNWSEDWVLRLVHHLAYEIDFFERAARIYLIYKEKNKSNRNDGWKELFSLKLSGTLAPPEKRIELLKDVLENGTPRQQEIAIEGIAAMLHSGHFSALHQFSFGARPRTFGWMPSSHEDILHWYGGVFQLIIEFAQPTSVHRDTLRKLAAHSLQSTLTWQYLYEEAIALIQGLKEPDGWPDAWVSIRIAMRRNEDIPAEHFEKLAEFEKLLRPSTLEQRIHHYLLVEYWDIVNQECDLDSADLEVTSSEVTSIIKKLAIEVAEDFQLLDKLLPDLLTSEKWQIRDFSFSLGGASLDIEETWQKIISTFSMIDSSRRNTQFLHHFIGGAYKVDPVLVNKLLDTAVDNPVLAKYFPLLEIHSPDDAGGKRLLQSLEYGVGPVDYFHNLRLQKVSINLCEEILTKLAESKEGFRAAIELLHTRIYDSQSSDSMDQHGIISIGRKILYKFNYKDRLHDDGFLYRISEVIKFCLSGTDAIDSMAKFINCFIDALKKHDFSVIHAESIIESIFQCQPIIALNYFLLDSYSINLKSMRSEDRSIVNIVDKDILLKWAQEDISIRAPRLASEINIYIKDEKDQYVLSPLAIELLKIAPNRLEVLNGFSKNNLPMIFWGGIENSLKPYQELLKNLIKNPESDITAWAKKELAGVEEEISYERKRNQQNDERFE